MSTMSSSPRRRSPIRSSLSESYPESEIEEDGRRGEGELLVLGFEIIEGTGCGNFIVIFVNGVVPSRRWDGRKF